MNKQELNDFIDQAVNPYGGEPLIEGPAVNALLKRLAAEIVLASEAAQANMATMAPGATLRAIRVVRATGQRVFYTGVGTPASPALEGLKQALAEAQPGDTVQQIMNLALPGGEQALLPAGVSLHLGGFSLDARGTGVDGLTLTDGAGVVRGGGGTVYHDAPYSWGLGIPSATMAFNYVFDNLNVVATGRPATRKPEWALILNMGRLVHSGAIVAATNRPAIIVGIPATTYTSGQVCSYEHTGPLTFSNQTVGFQVAKVGSVVQRGDLVVQDATSTAGLLLQGGTLEMRGSVLDLRATNAQGGFWLDPASSLTLTDVTVLGQVPAVPLQAGQAAGATVYLRGETVLPAGLAWAPELTIIDERKQPDALLYASPGPNPDGAMTQQATTAALATKADLVWGRVPADQLPDRAVFHNLTVENLDPETFQPTGYQFSTDGRTLAVGWPDSGAEYAVLGNGSCALYAGDAFAELRVGLSFGKPILSIRASDRTQEGTLLIPATDPSQPNSAVTVKALQQLAFTPLALRREVAAGAYAQGERTGAAPTGSRPGMKFSAADGAYVYEYMLGSADTDGTSYAWVRTLRG